jgi:hypothetical protein
MPSACHLVVFLWLRLGRHFLPSLQRGPVGTRSHIRPHDRTSKLIATLREQLEAERQGHAEARRIIAGLVERIPAIEAPETPPEAPEGSEPRPTTGEGQAATSRPWWQKMFRG